MKKKIITIVLMLIATIIFCLLVWPYDEKKSNKDKIISYVNDNYKTIEEFSYNNIADINFKSKEKEIIKKYLGKNTIVEEIYAYSDYILQFSCETSGFLDTGIYYGFYFSKKDAPYAFEFGKVDFIKVGTNAFEWYDEKGKSNEQNGHSIYTEKIRDNLWYYEMIWY